jgi:phosphoserine phosphatase RsbU/P
LAPRWRWRGDQLSYVIAVTTLLGVLALALSGVISLVAMFVLPPVLAALTLRPWGTAVVGAFATGWALVISMVTHSFSGQGRGSGLVVVALVSLISVSAAATRVRRETALRRISLVAEAAQASIVRPIPSHLGGLTFATVYRSAAEEARIGGDAYAAVLHLEGVRLLVADVRGKGLEAVGLAADVLASFREFAPGAVELVEVAEHMEQSIAPSLGPEDFVTAMLVDFSPHEFGVISCGHPWPLLRRGGTVCEVTLRHHTRPLGLGVSPVLETFPFLPGDQLLVFTDGLVETRDRHGVFFDPVAALGGAPAAASAADVISLLVGRLDEHAAGRFSDDLAVVIAEQARVSITPTVLEGVRVVTGSG